MLLSVCMCMCVCADTHTGRFVLVFLNQLRVSCKRDASLHLPVPCVLPQMKDLVVPFFLRIPLKRSLYRAAAVRQKEEGPGALVQVRSPIGSLGLHVIVLLGSRLIHSLGSRLIHSLGCSVAPGTVMPRKSERLSRLRSSTHM